MFYARQKSVSWRQQFSTIRCHELKTAIFGHKNQYIIGSARLLNIVNFFARTYIILSCQNLVEKPNALFFVQKGIVQLARPYHMPSVHDIPRLERMGSNCHDGIQQTARRPVLGIMQPPLNHVCTDSSAESRGSLSFESDGGTFPAYTQTKAFRLPTARSLKTISCLSIISN